MTSITTRKDNKYKFKKNLISASESNDFEEAKKEWIQVDDKQIDEERKGHCICNVCNLKYYIYFHNIKNGNMIKVGMTCKKKINFCKKKHKGWQKLKKVCKSLFPHMKYNEITNIKEYCTEVITEFVNLYKNKYDNIRKQHGKEWYNSNDFDEFTDDINEKSEIFNNIDFINSSEWDDLIDEIADGEDIAIVAAEKKAAEEAKKKADEKKFYDDYKEEIRIKKELKEEIEAIERQMKREAEIKLFEGTGKHNFRCLICKDFMPASWVRDYLCDPGPSGTAVRTGLQIHSGFGGCLRIYHKRRANYRGPNAIHRYNDTHVEQCYQCSDPIFGNGMWQSANDPEVPLHKKCQRLYHHINNKEC